jgi:hypothetical protein
MSKTFKGATRADAQSANPLDLCIVGGRALPEDERGPLDTDLDPKHPLHAHDLLNPLDPLDVDSVFEHGVIVPVEVVRVNDIPMVSLGRGRVRKARLANIRRKARGLPLIEVKFIVVRITDGVQLLSRMIDENLRRKTVGVLDQIELAKQMMARGASEEQTAQKLGVTMQRFKQWLAFEDHATPSTRAALHQNRLSPSAAIVMSAITDPAEQDKKLAELLATPQPTARAAKRLERGTKGKEDVSRPRLTAQKQLLTRVDKLARGNEWMQGAKAALRWVVGEGTHKDLDKLLVNEDDEEVEETARMNKKES